MINCPNCQTPNKIDAKFCKQCGASIHPTDAYQAGALSVSVQKGSSLPVSNENNPLEANTFALRPKATVFDQRYLFQGIVYSDSQRHCYHVIQTGSADAPRFRICSNPTCGAIGAEQFCTVCGASLSGDDLVLQLTESLQPLFNQFDPIAQLSLSHGGVRPPLRVFFEKLDEENRYYMLEPVYTPLNHPEPAQVLKWGLDLAQSLQYLHESGISFEGEIDESRFGMDKGRPVWSNFKNCRIKTTHPADDAADSQALAMQLFRWYTGKKQFVFDSDLLPAIQNLFNRALESPPGFTQARELAQAIEQVQRELQSAIHVDYRLGRLTDEGKVRTHNEDSLLTLEMSRIQQSAPQFLGVYVVADGMGGHSAGEVASGMLVDIIARNALNNLLNTPIQDRTAWLRQSILDANQWSSFGFIAAEKELQQLKCGNKTKN